MGLRDRRALVVRPVAVVLGAGMCLVLGVGAGASAAHATALAPAVPVAVVKASPPAILTEVESSAEDIVDYALSHDRGDVVAEAAILKSAATGPAAEELTRAGVSAQQVVALKRRANLVAGLARHGSFVDVALAANAVSQLMPSLYGRFRSSVPPTIFRLDYLDREAQLRSLAREPNRVTSAVAQLEQAWHKVRRKVIDAGGRTEAAAYEEHVASMRRLAPADGSKIQAEAARGLELVDDLEHVFSG